MKRVSRAPTSRAYLFSHDQSFRYSVMDVGMFAVNKMFDAGFDTGFDAGFDAAPTLVCFRVLPSLLCRCLVVNRCRWNH